MVRANDNWERLVEAVLRREQLWELFHAPSRTPSISSIASDWSPSSSSFNDTIIDLPFSDTANSYENFESRKQLEEVILKTLMQDDIYTIGICGTGGIGKSTMAKRIGELAKKEKLFDEIIMTVVSQQPDMEKIHRDIAEVVGLKLEEKDLQVRASQLCARIKDLSNILIILDDVWATLTLEDLGIPSYRINKRCKIMFISQNQDILEAMQVQRVFRVQSLSDDEAWIFFKGNVGHKVDDPNLQPFAIELVNECKGVPLALGILGLALKEDDEHSWKNALPDFKSCTPSTTPQVSDQVYQAVKLSYLWLSDDAKYLLILCCLFKEDSDIFLEELVRFGIGLDIFGGIGNLEETRSRVRAVATTLINRSLLEHGRDPINVNVHDVVRSVVTSIAEKNSYENISLVSRSTNEVLEELTRRHLLSLQEYKALEMLDNIFDGKRELKVLVMKDININSLPPSIILVMHLQTLHIHSCGVKTIDVVGLLVNLKILSCYDCDGIEILPAEIGRLNNLRLLELCKCPRLKKVQPGVISSLILLEELKIRGSFDQWEAAGGEEKGSNAALNELQSLSKLFNLDIEIQDLKVMATDMYPFSGVTNFCIQIGTEDKTICHTKIPHPYKNTEYQKYMQLSLPNETIYGGWINDLLRKTESLSLSGNGSINLNFEEFLNMKKFRFWHCSRIIYLITSSSEGIFCVLESLDLKDLRDLQEICHGPLPVRSFWNLRDLKLYEMPGLVHLWKNSDQIVSLINLTFVDIRNCKMLPYLFTLSIARSLVQLEELRILFCGMMKEVLLNDENVTTDSIAFPRLKKLILHSLPSLVVFCRGTESMWFPKLEVLSIRNLPKLHGFLAADSSMHVFINQKVEFDSLKELNLQGLDDRIIHIWSLNVPISYFSKIEILHICSCNKLRNLFSASFVRGLLMLKELHIKDSLMMTEVILNEDQKIKMSLFPSLERLELWRLRSLRSFCQWKQVLELASLRHLHISLCPEMQTFTLGFMSTPVLDNFRIDNERIEMKDLNAAIRQRYRSKFEQPGSTSTAYEIGKGKNKVRWYHTRMTSWNT